jgi:hypothetical protein
VRTCPSCDAPAEPEDLYCGHCGAELVPEVSPVDEPDAELRLPAVLQGVAPDWSCTGSFDAAEYEGLTYEDALGVLNALPRPPDDTDPGQYCWPNLVFEDGTSVCRAPEGDDGDYFLYPEDRYCTLPEAEAAIRELYLRGGGGA